MTMRAKDTGKVPDPHGRGPGWFARSPAMVILPTLRRGFLSLRPLVNKFSTWSHKISSRWMPRPFTGKAWHPILHLSLHRGKPSHIKKDSRLTLNPPGRKPDNSWALHTLSLPEKGRFEEVLKETWNEEASLIESNQETEPSLQGNELENNPSVYAETFAGSENGSAQVEHSTSQVSPRRESTRISRPEWPFRLVGPFIERREPHVLHLEREMELRRKLGPRLPVDKVLARSVTNLEYLQKVVTQLKPRQMVAPQAPIAGSFFRLAPLQPGQSAEPLTLVQRRWQRDAKPSPVELRLASFEDQQSWPFEPGDRDQRIPLKSAIDLESTKSLGEGGAPAERSSLELARARRQEGHHPRPSSAQVRPPSAMLLLQSARQPAIEPGKVTLARPAWSQADQDWPLLSVLRRIETHPEEPGESSAMQVLRRMWPEQAPVLRQAVESISRLGPGEALAPEVRRPMETQTGRDLSDVRVHSSPLAQTMRAEAFTTGKHVVFAPGRLDLTTSKGFALLGHELTHIGQALAFKQESGASQVYEDSGEREARHQEGQIQRIVEQGWTKSNQMELQHTFRSTAGPAASTNSLAIQRLADDNIGLSQQEQPAGGPAPANPANATSAQAAQSSSQPGSGPASGPAGAPAANANVETLARQVYAILKNRLRAERDRHQLYNF